MIAHTSNKHHSYFLPKLHESSTDVVSHPGWQHRPHRHTTSQSCRNTSTKNLDGTQPPSTTLIGMHQKKSCVVPKVDGSRGEEVGEEGGEAGGYESEKEVGERRSKVGEEGEGGRRIRGGGSRQEMKKRRKGRGRRMRVGVDKR